MTSGSPILVTGATGYLGAAAATALEDAGQQVLRASRRPVPADRQSWRTHADFATPDARFDDLVSGCRAVVHLAGLAHVAGSGPGARGAAEAANGSGTRRLAEAAARAGVERFVFISTAQVLGTRSPDRPLLETDHAAPADLYAESKNSGEQHLADLARASGLPVVVLRPPMVYGPNAPGNFTRLARAVARGIPLPLGAARAPKSFVSRDNLMSAMVRATLDPRALRQTFLVADAERASTAALIRLIAAGLGVQPRLITIPEPMVRVACASLGRDRLYARLFDPFELDTRHVRDTLDWVPPLSLEEGVSQAVAPLRARA